MTYHHHITSALAAAVLIAVGALSASTGAVAHPARDAGTSASGHAVVRQPHAVSGAITFTNPLGRSRGPGAGAGQL